MTKRKKQQALPWCWYCDREFEDEKVLINHQKAKHFKCHYCHKKLNSGSGLVIHIAQLHKETICRIPNALEGHDSPEVEIYGMDGVPQEDLERHRRGESIQAYKRSRLTEPGAGMIPLLAAQKAAIPELPSAPLPEAIPRPTIIQSSSSLHPPLPPPPSAASSSPSTTVATAAAPVSYVTPPPAVSYPPAAPGVSPNVPYSMPAVPPTVSYSASATPMNYASPPMPSAPGMYYNPYPYPYYGYQTHPHYPPQPGMPYPPQHPPYAYPSPYGYAQPMATPYHPPAPATPYATPQMSPETNGKVTANENGLVRIDPVVDEETGKIQPGAIIMVADLDVSIEEKRAALAKYKSS